MAAVMMPGAPVAEAVFADLEPRIKALRERGRHARARHDPRRRRLARARATSASSSARPRSSASTRRTSTSRDDATQADLIAAIREFNDDPAVDGYLVQHPTPPQIDFDAALLEIDPDKDVDGLHPVNLGRLALGDARPGAVHARGDRGAARVLRDPGRPAARSCILGRGTTLGRPLAILLSQKRPTANAAVTVVHTGVPDWPRYTQRADIVVAAAGVPGILQPEHITPGRGRRGRRRAVRGQASCCPTSTSRCEEVAGYITPRVGGVGPTTIAMLFRNAVEAAERKAARNEEGSDDPVPVVRCGAPGRRSAARSATWTPASVPTGRARSPAAPCGP